MLQYLILFTVLMVLHNVTLILFTVLMVLHIVTLILFTVLMVLHIVTQYLLSLAYPNCREVQQDANGGGTTV